MTSSKLGFIVASVFFLAAPSVAGAAVLYVDGQLGVSDCTDYDPGSRSCGGGTEAAFDTLAAGAAAAQPGDEVVIREGTYNEQLDPPTSGTAGNPITFRNQTGETVTLTGGHSPATVILDQVSYIIIEGLSVADARWVEATDAHNNIIRNCTFLRTPASGTTGNVRFISSNNNRIVGNVLDDGNDNLLLIDSGYNLVEGNTITEGGHSLLSIRCADFNIFRNNHFANTQQKIGEVYDCGTDTSAVPHQFDSTTHNVFEHNVFAEASSYYSTSGGNGIQYAGQDGIIRRNVFYLTNVGIGMQVYGDEALYNHRNRVYHNVFFNNDCAGVSLSSSVINAVFKNNIFFQNNGVSGDCFGDGPAQLVYRPPLQEVFFERNNLMNDQAGEEVITEEFGSGGTLSDYHTNFPALFVDNVEADPGFTDVSVFDFTLQATSAMVDAGAFLTRAVGGGNGTTLQVDDARYFHDGFGIQGVTGDVIQLEGQTDTATVTAVDYDTDTLTLDTALTWTDGQGVALSYQGVAPDIGAFELGVMECSDGMDNDGDGLTDFPEDTGCSAADDSDETDCGDSACEGGETCQTCEPDCGVCPACTDNDGDGYGDPASPLCTNPELDCDDSDDAVNPNASELCSDSVDNNCDGLTDAEDTAACPEDPNGGSSKSGCGCRSADSSPAGFILVLLVLLSLWNVGRHKRIWLR